MAGMQPPRSPTLAPPRKSVELEDPGAHELESSNDEDDVFSDAPDGRKSPRSRYGQTTQAANPGGIPIPKTVVEKVDPMSPSHGEVPGTAAHDMRSADALPDVITQAPRSSAVPEASLPMTVPIPRTVITKVDPNPTYGEVPGTDAYELRTNDAKPDNVEEEEDVSSWPTSSVHRFSHSSGRLVRSHAERTSPIAADGGFGPMSYDEDEANSDDIDDTYESKQERGPLEEYDENEAEGYGGASGEDFDDFEEGAASDEFGDFGGGQFMTEEESQPNSSKQASQILITPFPLINFPTVKGLEDLMEATSEHISALFPTTIPSQNSTFASASDSSSVFLTDRSLSLWTQLVAPPPLQPPDWTRSRIRRLFLVSLGVPIDLDEILPASKQKKLILPFTSSETASNQEPRKGSLARLKQSEINSSTNFVDNLPSTPSPGIPRSGNKKRRGPAPPPEFDVVLVRQLCATTNIALQSLRADELEEHVARLEGLTRKGKEVLQYWIKRKEAAVGDKEVFEGVIENLVRHARRVRK